MALWLREKFYGIERFMRWGDSGKAAPLIVISDEEGIDLLLEGMEEPVASFDSVAAALRYASKV